MPQQRHKTYPIPDRVRKAGRWRAAGKQAAFMLIIFCGFFAMLELALALFGIRPGLETEDPLVVFSGYTPLFVEDTRDDGQVIMKTSEEKLLLFNHQEFPRIKGDDTYRVFCLGGSTTYGHPYRAGLSFCGWLNAYLTAAEPGRNWEVINAGGISYASYRVARLMNELVDYQPDLFIVYTGQNEFLEERSYGRLVDLPYWMLRTDAILSETRTYTALRRLVRTIDSNPQPQGDTRHELSGEADDVLRHTIGPTSFHRDDELRMQILNHFRINLDRIMRIGRGAGAEVLFINPVVNLRDMSPFKSEHRSDLGNEEKRLWKDAFDRATEFHDAGDPAKALEYYQQAEAIDDRYAELHYRIGRAWFDLDQYQKAEQALWRAVDEDVAPLRMLSPMQDILREVALRNQIPLIDFSEKLRKAYLAEHEHAIFGNEYFLGHVHMTIEAYRLLGIAVLEHMIATDLVTPLPAWGEEMIAVVTEDMLESVDLLIQGDALLTLARTFEWAGKTEEARHLILLQLDLIGPNAPGYELLGRHTARAGEPDAAAEHYIKALELDSELASAHRFLADIHMEQGRIADAIRHYRETVRIEPGHYHAHDRLGLILAMQGEIEAAEHHFREALRYNPDHAPAGLNLITLLANQQRYDEAISRGLAMLRAHPDNDQLHNSLGALFARIGEFGRAIDHFSSALRLNPEFESARENLRRAEARRRGE